MPDTKEDFPSNMSAPSSDDNASRSSRRVSRRVSVPHGYQISEEFRSSLQASVVSNDGLSKATWSSKLGLAWAICTQGGTIFDGFLLAVSQEVGQSILTLPNVFSRMGFISGVLFELFFATMALYTNWLLVTMHAQYRFKLKDEDDPRHHDKYYIASYHEIMESLVGTWMKRFSLVVVFFALLGLTTVQIIATSSNFYILDSRLSKRDWSLIWGAIFSLIAFVRYRGCECQCRCHYLILLLDYRCPLFVTIAPCRSLAFLRLRTRRGS